MLSQCAVSSALFPAAAAGSCFEQRSSDHSCSLSARHQMAGRQINIAEHLESYSRVCDLTIERQLNLAYTRWAWTQFQISANFSSICWMWQLCVNKFDIGRLFASVVLSACSLCFSLEMHSSIWSCGQMFTCTHHGYEWHGNLGLLMVYLNCFFFHCGMILQYTSLMTEKQSWI